jgi:hypothetical protein
LDTGFPTVALTEAELYSLLMHICNDLNWELAKLGLPIPVGNLPLSGYYHTPVDWFCSYPDPPSAQELQEALARGIDIDSDFGLYFLNLCSLHKRRLKFQKILLSQAKPTMDQVGARGLLEFGICDDDLLSNWLIWRKWIFDIDNRAGQETGYLFEPILASCLGGEAVGATNSPVKRLDESGQQTTAGRQIDCYLGAESMAYEFKIRVTIAASGQGRFSEELSFPKECRAAGITPVLMVLDPTRSTRLDELSTAFRRYDGIVYVGEQAWSHLEERSGTMMSRFIDNYIKPPLKKINEFDTPTLSPIKLIWDGDRVVIQSESRKYEILRAKDH